MKHLVLVLVLTLLAACNPTRVADDAAAANALLGLRDSYLQARRQLDARIDSLPTEAGLRLLELESAADRYVARLTRIWKQGATLDEIDLLHAEGVALYHRGESILRPLLPQLAPDTVAALARFQAQAQRVEALYQQLRTGGDAQQRELLRAGLELATLALRVGAVAVP